MKKTVRIITLIVSALLLIGAVIGITVSAEDNAPAVAIKYKNLAYEGAIQVLYAVEAENVPEGAKVQMYFYDTKDATEPSFIKDEYTDEALTIGGKTYRAFFSKGIAPKNMRKPIYAAPVIVNGDEIVAKGECVEYSIYNYAINMFNKTPTVDQEELYTSLLDYGASVQKVLLGGESYPESELALAGGYANEYCGVKVATVVDNVIVEDGEFLGYFAPETLVDLTADLYYKGAMFTGFTNTKREIVGDYAYATTAYTAEPGIAGFYRTYRSDFSSNDYTKGYISGSYNAYVSSKGYTNNYTVGKTDYNAIVNYGTEDAPNYALQHTHKDGVESGTINYVFGTVGKAYVFETDLCFGGVVGAANSDNWQGRIGFVSAATNGRSSEKNYTGYTYMYAKDGEAMTIEGATLPVGEWARFRFEYVSLGFYRGSYHHIMRVYKNGDLVKSIEGSTDVDNSDCLKFQIGTRTSGNAGGWTMMIDNTVCYTVSEDYYGKGVYNDIADTYDSDKTYANATVVEELDGNNVLNFSKTNGNSPALTFTLDAVSEGEKYVFDTDIMWEEMPLDSYGRTWIGRFGFVSQYTNTYSENDKLIRPNSLIATPANGALLNNSTSGGSISESAVKSAPKLTPGTWYNLRMEYTPLGVDADGFYSGNQKIYLNGVLISDHTQKEIIDSKYLATRGQVKNNLGLHSFAFNTLGLNSFTMKLDNTFFGVVGETDDYKLNDFATPKLEVEKDGKVTTYTNKEAVYPYVTISEKADCVSGQTIVANPVVTDAKSAANYVLKAVTDNTSETQCVNYIYPSNTGAAAEAHGVYELELEMMIDPNSELPQNDSIFQQFVLNSSGGYVTLYRLTHTGDGVVKFHAESGGKGGGNDGKGNQSLGEATILDGQWHHIRFVYYKNGTDSATAIYVDGNLIGAKANIYYMTESAVTKSTVIKEVNWRIKPYNPSGDAIAATYYFDNVGFRYAGPIPEVIPELAK